jgi:para-nitrobenzyl esterase
MTKMYRVLLALLFSSVAVPPALHAAIQDPVRIEQGLLSGDTDKNSTVRVYRGIPYAAAPTGDLRWKPPAPPPHWQGTRQATEFGNTCMQMLRSSKSIVDEALTPSQPQSEDCLFLNIWTAAKTLGDKRPVMVFIHGGGFTMSAGSIAAYDGDKIASKGGVVLVTINYRLGVFGFFALPELAEESPHHAAGNYAVMDMIAALQWVKKNIAAFGGDPDNVTIFGQSAGSWGVNLLQASPLANGLFQRAIGESGGNFSEGLRAGSTGGDPAQYPEMMTLGDGERAGEKIASQAGATTDPLQTLRALPAQRLIEAYKGVNTWPIVDGWVIPKDVWTIYAQGEQNDVPTIVGNNADEATIYLSDSPKNITPDEYVANAKKKFGAVADQFLKAYPGTTKPEAVASTYAAFRDERHGWEMRTWARMQTKTGHQPVYRYYFTRVAPGPQAQPLRAFHTLELSYVYGNFKMYAFPWTDEDHKYSNAVMAYWTNFAGSGNPNATGLPKWPVYNASDDDVLQFGSEIAVRTHVNQAGLDFFDAYHAAFMSAEASRGGKTAKPNGSSK